MVRDANAPISVSDANQIAQQITAGNVSVIIEDGTPQFRHKDHPFRQELRDDDLTEAGIENALEGWEDWPNVE